MRKPRGVWFLAAALLISLPSFGSSASQWLSISISKPFFNPSLGQSVEITVHSTRPGRLTATIVDPLGNFVRRLPIQEMRASHFLLTWDGRDEAARIVPNEAYSLSLTLESPQSSEDYPGRKQAPEDVQVTQGGFDRQRGVTPPESWARQGDSSTAPDSTNRA